MKHGVDPKTVLVAPFFSNPYQALLAAQLEPLDIAITNVQTTGLATLSIQAVRNQIQIVHLHWLHPFFVGNSNLASLRRFSLFLLNLVILRLLGVKIVWTVHNIHDHEKRHPILDRICTSAVLWLSHAVITHCESAKKELTNEFAWVRAQKVHSIVHGNYVGYYENHLSRQQACDILKLPSGHTIFLTVGQLREYKGIPELIAAFNNLRNNNYLVIAGAPVNKTIAEKIHREVDGRANILFHPRYIPKEEMQIYLSACDVVVFPYRNTLTSGAAILAMSFGRPCIVSRAGCMPDILDQSGCFTFDESKQGDLQQALEHALERRGVLPEMGRHNFQLAKQMRWEFAAQMTAKLYRQL